MRPLLKRARRWLYLGHRWLGIAACALFVLWFLSGLVMMYIRSPALTETEALAGYEPIDWARLRLAPDAALAAAGAQFFPRELRLQMQLGEPVYRVIGWDGGRGTRSAVDGRAIEHIDAHTAAAIAARFAGTATARWRETLDHDMWTAAARFDAFRPMHRVSLDDAAGTELYVSVRGGEVVLDSTRFERGWNRLGVVLHYNYLAALRADAPLWRQVILWLSGAGMAVAFSGTLIGVLRLRLRRRYKNGSITPYRGWMRWHHVGGLIGGVVICTWITSGWLSMRPNQWLSRPQPATAALQAYAGHSAPTFGAGAGALAALPGDSREARFSWVGGQPLLVLADARGWLTALDGHSLDQRRFSDQALFAAARRLLPGSALITAQRLERDDAYWYSQHHRQRPLPVLRAVFDDAAATWAHIDPATGQLLELSDRGSRLYRWLFNALHSFDFRWLQHQRPLWDVVVWTLSLAGLLVSVSGVVIGWRRLLR